MFNITNFLHKFTKIHSGNTAINGSICNAIEKVADIRVDSKSFLVENGILRLNLSPVVKNEIYMHKSKILSEINSSNFIIKDIR